METSANSLRHIQMQTASGLWVFRSKSCHSGSTDNGEKIQLAGVAKGLIYIHSQGMIHGDLKGVRLWR